MPEGEKNLGRASENIEFKHCDLVCLKIFLVSKVSVILVYFCYRTWQCSRCFSGPYENNAANRGAKRIWVKTIKICRYLKVGLSQHCPVG